MERSSAGTGIRVSRERLQPLGVTGAYFAVALLVFSVVPPWIAYSANELAQGLVIHPKVVVLVHLYALGWGAFTALGALRQLAPVVFQAPDRGSPAWSWAGFGMLLLGFALFVPGFALNRYGLVAAGGALMTAAFVIGFAALRAAAVKKSRGSVIEAFALLAALSLVATGVLGVLVALHRVTGLLGSALSKGIVSHMFFGPLGFYGFLVLGVSYELAPFFGLTRVERRETGEGKLERAVLALLLLGLAGGWGAALVGLGHPALLLPVAAALAVFVFDLRAVYRRRDPIRNTATLTGVRAAHLYLAAIAVMIAAGAAFPHLWSSLSWIRAFAWLIAAGWLSNAIAAYLHRILPFVVWHNRYWGAPKEAIRTRFPDMVSQRLGRRGFYLYNAGVIAVLAGFADPSALVLAAGLLTAGTWMLSLNLLRTFFR